MAKGIVSTCYIKVWEAKFVFSTTSDCSAFGDPPLRYEALLFDKELPVKVLQTILVFPNQLHYDKYLFKVSMQTLAGARN